MSARSRLQPVGLRNVTVDDRFWAPRLRTNREVTVGHALERCEETGRVDNFRRAAGDRNIPLARFLAPDSDVYKCIEGAAYLLQTEPDPELEGRLDALIETIAAAQAPDGYLYTEYVHERASERWSDLRHMHELYCAGHLIEAAVAHHQATGKRSLLDVAGRFADNIAREFGPDGRAGAPGHPEIELALVKLYRHTHNREYLRLARFFIDQRGSATSQLEGHEAVQDHAPVREQQDIRGHAVRAGYLMTGVVDLYCETGDEELWDAAVRLWENMAHRRSYITGGVGSRHHGEAFGDDYELPNDLAYAETCAAIANVFWSYRMLSATGDARYADMVERALYNGVLSGVGIDGRHFFYGNVLEARRPRRRVPWFGVPCCPTNVVRLLGSLPSHLYSVSRQQLWVHLYAAGACTAEVPGVGPVTLRVSTDYPWDGHVELEVTPREPASFTLELRIPGWCDDLVLEAPENIAHEEPRAGSYVALAGRWEPGMTVALEMGMPVRTMLAHPHTANTGCGAVVRGPLLYCLEEADHPGVDLFDIALGSQTRWSVDYRPDLPGGVVALTGQEVLRQQRGWDNALYRSTSEVREPERKPIEITAVPYCAWGNRTPGKMRVWIPLERLPY